MNYIAKGRLSIIKELTTLLEIYCSYGSEFTDIVDEIHHQVLELLVGELLERDEEESVND
jgi:hypothetical protein